MTPISVAPRFTMKATNRILALLLLATGCGTPAGKTDMPQMHDKWVGDHVRRAQMEEAALVERILYPHHFVPHASRLSPLGERHLALLVTDLSEAPGELVVRRGTADEALYAARLEVVKDGLLAAGLAEGDFTLADGHPDGRGVSSDRVIEVLTEDPGAQTPDQSIVHQAASEVGGSR